MPDPFEKHMPGLSSPGRALSPVTKDDDDDLPGGTCRALLVGTGGTANVIDAAGNDLASVPLQTGYNPVRIARVKTGGTADDIWAIY
jgi:hypothetical protein